MNTSYNNFKEHCNFCHSLQCVLTHIAMYSKWKHHQLCTISVQKGVFIMLKRIVRSYTSISKLITFFIEYSLVQVNCLFQVLGQSGSQV